MVRRGLVAPLLAGSLAVGSMALRSGTAGLESMSADELAEVASDMTPAELTSEFCDQAEMGEMAGLAQDEMQRVEGEVLKAVEGELEKNNVDQMAKDIFSFYVCVRWAPDKVFWKLAQKELPAMFAKHILSNPTNTEDEGKAPTEAEIQAREALAIAEMYRTYRFVPMLCSKNIQVFDERDEDGTYFHKFKSTVKEFSDFVVDASAKPTYKNLTEVDGIFCGNDVMTSCDKWKFFERIFSVFGAKTKEEKQQVLAERLARFADSKAVEFRDWKTRFPYHSFIGKPADYKADIGSAPKADQRFVVCFGKRVASEMHRRKNGQHILTDQNNVGCHGWYNSQEAVSQLTRMVEMWKPPTCQLATMSYTMKKEIMAKFAAMNEMLFDALPSLINDELETEDREGQFNFEEHLPQPYAAAGEVVSDGITFVHGMVVSARKEHRCGQGKVHRGSFGTVKVSGGKLSVEWVGYTEACDEEGKNLVVMPHGWNAKKGFTGHVRDFIAGVSHVSSRAVDFFKSLFPEKQRNIADLMSGSISKWAVCPISSSVDLNRLDANLGTDDPAFQDFQKDGYKKWTGFSAALPGDQCQDGDASVASQFPGAKVCEISELHSDWVEKYTKNDTTGELENFICPIRPPLLAGEQLEVFKKKKGTCYLHMTGRQERQYSWHYQGFFPARKQINKQENAPRTEYELVKIIDVEGEKIEGEASYARLCSVDELKAKPRFCHLPKLFNDLTTAEEVVTLLSDTLSDVVDNAGKAVSMENIGATVVEDSVKNVEQKATQASGETGTATGTATGTEKTWKNTTKEGLTWAGEKSWDAIRGAARFVKASASYGSVVFAGKFTGEGRMGAELHDRVFGKDTNGNLLHALSYQRSKAAEGLNSVEREHFSRYAMAVPCPDFEPGLHFAHQGRWSKIAVRAVVEAVKQWKHRNQGVLDHATLNLFMRGEAFLYKNIRSRTSTVFKNAKASMLWEEAASLAGSTPQACKYSSSAGRCEPTKWCSTKAWPLIKSDGNCRDRVPWWRSVEAGGWWTMGDKELSRSFAPMFTTGQFDWSSLRGVKMTLWCGKKSDFDGSVEAGGRPPSTSAASLKECMQNGIVANEQMKAREPWKLYHPEEVIVVASFTEIPKSAARCLVSKKAKGNSASYGEESAQVCPEGVSEDEDNFKHLIDGSKSVPWGEDVDSRDVFVGARSGFGFPKATLQEVVLQPQDILEATGLFAASHGR